MATYKSISLALGFAAMATAVTSLQTASAADFSRTETTQYHDNLDKWVLGQVESVKCVASVPASAACDGDVVSQTRYSSYAQPLTIRAFGKVLQTRTHDVNTTGQRGTVKTVKDGRGNTTTLANWSRGTPQSISYADGTSEAAVVNDDGTLAQVTDENGIVTKYQYDALGRLKLIDYPDGDTVAWTSTSRTFSHVGGVYGLPAHWRMWERTGTGYKLTHYDALLRPVVVETYDNADAANTRSIVVNRYDAVGRLVFQSYPVRSLGVWTDASLAGTTTSYDALDRVRTVTQSSELGNLSTTTTYLNNANGHYTLVTDPNGNKTRTWFQAYDEPTHSNPVTIWHPEGAFTHITRDPFGKPTRLRRSDSSSATAGAVAVNRDYYYDSHQQLCRTSEPETGDTFMGYDAAGNLAWSAAGYNSTATGCLAASSVEARRVDRSYDERNRVETLNFPDGRGDTLFDYTPDGLLEAVTALNGDTGEMPITSTYSYNRRRLLTGETMRRGATTPWYIGYDYNANGHLSRLDYPSDLSVDYAPNGLGQPTRAGIYATGVTYHPNGAIKQFTYGNGIVHTMTQNARLLPERSRDAYGSTVIALDDSYDYDANGNVAAISDALPGYRGNRDMVYDGLDRLTRVTSPMFGSSGEPTHAYYFYDVLDNITRVKMLASGQARDHYYCYDSKQRLTFLRTGAVCSGTASPAVRALTYDFQGNVASKDNVDFDFDFGNRLRAAVGNETYWYDGHGRRVQSNSSTGNIVSHYSQSGQLLYQQDYKDQQRYEYVYLGGSLVAMPYTPHGGTRATQYQHTDALGSVVARSSAGRSSVIRNEYEPFGALIGRVNYDRPGFTGHVMDEGTGLTYMQQRYYDPMLGRFLSVDPITSDGTSGGNFNRYWYGNNNPYRFTDPDGRLAGDRLREMERGMGGRDPKTDIFLRNALNEEGQQASGCDTPECTEVKATRRAFFQQGGERLKEAGIYGAKEGAMMFGGGAFGKALGKLGRFFRFSKADAVNFRSDTSHIFRNARGHLADDTPANRNLLRSAVRPDTLVGTRGPRGSISVYRENLSDGRQVWVEVRNGSEITNGGVNLTPRP